jgi:class 3 adenylate cyclase
MAEDEATTIRMLSDYREAVAMLVRQHRGRVVDTPGDNLLAEFPTARDAVRCGVEIQAVLGARNASLASERRMDFRIGIHMGDVAVEGDRIYGDGVNIAARLEGLAEAGGVCISATVHEQVRNKLEISCTSIAFAPPPGGRPQASPTRRPPLRIDSRSPASAGAPPSPFCPSTT